MRDCFLSGCRIVAALVFCVLLAHCKTTPRTVLSDYMKFDVPVKRATNPADVALYVSTSKQVIYAVEKDKLLMAAPVTIGKAESPTPMGQFFIQKKDRTHRSNTHGWARLPKSHSYMRCYKDSTPEGWAFVPGPLPYWMEFYDSAYGLHTGYVYPYPKSNGCIRLHANIAPKLFELCRVGTPVFIAEAQPWDKKVASSLKRPVNPERIEDDPYMECSPRIFNDHKAVTWDE